MNESYRIKASRKYNDLPGNLHLVHIDITGYSQLGISLAGNKDITKISIFVVDLKPNFPAFNSGLIRIGDELLEVNDKILYGRCHLNVTPIFRSFSSNKFKILILRSPDAINNFAVLYDSSLIRNDENYSTLIKRIPGLSTSINPFFDMDSSDTPVFEGSECPPLFENNNDSIFFFESGKPNETLDKHNNELQCIIKSNKVENVFNSEIIPQNISKIEISRTNLPLGLRIIGGSNTSLKGLFVYDIYKGGAAYKDSRLQIGDQILEINDENCQLCSLTEAMHVLRVTIPTVKLSILRGKSEETILKDQLKIYLVELPRRPDKALGFTVSSKRANIGLIVSDLIRGSLLHLENLLCVGDELISINGETVSDLKTEEAIFKLKALRGKINLEVLRSNIGLDFQSSTFQLSSMLLHSNLCTTSNISSVPTKIKQKSKYSFKRKNVITRCFYNNKDKPNSV